MVGITREAAITDTGELQAGAGTGTTTQMEGMRKGAIIEVRIGQRVGVEAEAVANRFVVDSLAGALIELELVS